MKKIISLLLAIIMALSSITIAYADDIVYDYNLTQLEGNVLYLKNSGSGALIAINPYLSINEDYGAYFNHSENDGQKIGSLSQSYNTSDNAYKYITDSHTGETLFIKASSFDSPIYLESNSFGAFGSLVQNNMEASYVANSSTKIILDPYTGTKKNMKCIIEGQYCTIWACINEGNNLILSDVNAQLIANKFDSWYTSATSCFGSWYDCDGDNKIAILCHDMESSKANNFISGGYYAGCFVPDNLMNQYGEINGIKCQLSEHRLNMDCIHLDTYPGMGNDFDDVDRCYSTLVHEFQHLINYSYTIKDHIARDSMERYINEAFSMAAEHVICGQETVQSRISDFNSSEYVQGTSLSYWADEISNYSNSYLFGQYIRTQYAQLHPDGQNGATIFKTTLEQKAQTNNSDTLAVICHLLDDINAERLVMNFWTALYLKQATGPYGFNGETWAKSISVHINNSRTNPGKFVGNGSAVYYTYNKSLIENEDYADFVFVGITNGSVVERDYGTINFAGTIYSDTQTDNTSIMLYPYTNTDSKIKEYLADAKGSKSQALYFANKDAPELDTYTNLYYEVYDFTNLDDGVYWQIIYKPDYAICCMYRFGVDNPVFDNICYVEPIYLFHFGDMDGNGEINAVDLDILNKCIDGTILCYNNTYYCGDFNEDYDLTAEDFQYLFEIVTE